jgi:hypothetical protein
MRFRIHSGRFALCQLPSGTLPPDWAYSGAFHSVTVTPEEVSIICAQNSVPQGVKMQRNYVLLEIEGPFDFNAIGILQSFLTPLAQARIPIFAVSTYNTDFVLVHEEFEPRALEALKLAGYELVAAL